MKSFLGIVKDRLVWQLEQLSETSTCSSIVAKWHLPRRTKRTCAFWSTGRILRICRRCRQGCAFACEIRKIRMRSENFAKFRIRIASQSPFRVSINFAKCQNIFMRIFRIMRNFAKCEYSRANSSRNFAKCEFSRAISLRTAISFEMQDFARFDFFKVRDFK